MLPCSVHPRCRGSTRGGLSLGPPSTCYTYICDSSTPATRTRETSFVTRLRAALVMPRVHVVVTLVSTDPAAAVDRGRIVVVVPVLSSRSRHTGRITGMRSRRARISGGGGTRPHPLLGRRGPPWPRQLGRAHREGTTYLIADRLRAAPHVCPACIACLSFSSMRVTPRLYGERYLPEASSRFDERDAAPFCRALLRAR